MKLTVDELRRILDAVNHETHRVAKHADLCACEGRDLSFKYYHALENEYKELFYKLVNMLDDITE